MEEKGYSTGSMILAVLIGGVVGAGIALLTAPQSGRETREKIKDLTDEAKEKIKSTADEARAKIVETLKSSKERVVEGKHALTVAVEAGKKAMEEERHRIAGS